MRTDLEHAAHLMTDISKCVVLTGAGVSAESGIPTFRGAGGLWEGNRAEALATPEAFERDPHLVWRFYRWRRRVCLKASPNPGHLALVSLASLIPSFELITQNVDGLHALAGSNNLIELHGNIHKARCTACGCIVDLPMEDAEEENGPLPQCRACKGLMRPHILWFGEHYWPGVLENALQVALDADVVMVVGTSAQISMPASLATQAVSVGASLIEVNPERTPLSSHATLHLAECSGKILPSLVEKIKNIRKRS